MTDLSIDGRTPQQQIDECLTRTRDIEKRTRDAFETICVELERNGLLIADWEHLSEDERAALREHYFENIYPLVTPQATDPAHPFPFISNLAVNLLVGLHHPKEQNISLARVKVPVGGGIPRMLKIPGRDAWVRMELVLGTSVHPAGRTHASSEGPASEAPDPAGLAGAPPGRSIRMLATKSRNASSWGSIVSRGPLVMKNQTWSSARRMADRVS